MPDLPLGACVLCRGIPGNWTCAGARPPCVPKGPMPDSLTAQRIEEARQRGATFMRPFRVLVTGSRTWQDGTAVFGALDDLLREHRIVRVIHGACPEGADKIAQQWVIRTFRSSLLGFAEAEPHPARWHEFGKAAGFRRNAEMVKAGADLCLAFIDECRDPKCRRRPIERHGSHGASHCADLAEKAGIPVRRITDG
jgi:YspA, cpYpsA-related SLOG family